MTTSNNLAGLINSSTGNIVIPTSNAGINFNNSSAIGAATLNDYETGTWTPVLTATTGTITSQTGTGSYVKIGKIVTLTFQVQITGGTISVIGNLTGFPFALNSTQNYVTACAREWYATGYLWEVIGSIAGTQAQLVRYDNNSSCGSNYAWGGTFTYITNS